RQVDLSLPPLDGVYVDHDPLCEVTPIPGSNRAGVEAELVMRQKHVKTKLASDRLTTLLPTASAGSAAAFQCSCGGASSAGGGAVARFVPSLSSSSSTTRPLHRDAEYG